MKRRSVHPAIKWGCFVPLIAVAVLVCVVFLLDWLMPSAARSKLPASATKIQEYYSCSWNGDFVRVLKAKLPEEDYAAYARRLGLATLFDPAIHHYIEGEINMGVGDAPKWWNPPMASKTTYFKHARGDDHLEVLSYSNGCIYYLVSSW